MPTTELAIANPAIHPSINQSIYQTRIEIDQPAMAVEEAAAAGSAAGSSLMGEEGAGEAMPPLSPRALAAIRCVQYIIIA